MEIFFDTRATEDTLQKTSCAEHSEVAQFVENILDLEETENTPEKITCYPNFVHFMAFFQLHFESFKIWEYYQKTFQPRTKFFFMANIFLCEPLI